MSFKRTGEVVTQKPTVREAVPRVCSVCHVAHSPNEPCQATKQMKQEENDVRNPSKQ